MKDLWAKKVTKIKTKHEKLDIHKRYKTLPVQLYE